MTTANKVTIVRILLVPFFICQVIYYNRTGLPVNLYCAIGAFFAASIADGVDGYIARHFNQRSELGAILDPLADKLLLVSGIVLLSMESRYFVRIPVYLTATVISRDVILVIGLAIIHYTGTKFSVRPHITGKIATVLQMATVLWTLLQLNPVALPYITISAAAFTGVSGLLYVINGMTHLNAHPSSGPTSPQS
jgi:CDP-diacylglycerol--glycerol-3-phosphate 3-phosphatidyltransferase